MNNEPENLNVNQDNENLKLNSGNQPQLSGSEADSVNELPKAELMEFSSDDSDLALPSGSLQLAAVANSEFKQNLKQQFLDVASKNAASLQQMAASVDLAEVNSSQLNAASVQAKLVPVVVSATDPAARQEVVDSMHREQHQAKHNSGTSLAFVFPFLGGVTFGLVLLVAFLGSGFLNTDIFLPDNNQPILVDNQQVLDQVYANNAPELVSAINGEFDGLGSVVDISITPIEVSSSSTATSAKTSQVSQSQTSGSQISTQTSSAQSGSQTSSSTSLSPQSSSAASASSQSSISVPTEYILSTSTTTKTPGIVNLVGCTNTKIQNLLQAVNIVEISSPDQPQLGKKIISYDSKGDILSVEIYVDNKAYIYKSGSTGTIVDLSNQPNNVSSSSSVSSAISALSSLSSGSSSSSSISASGPQVQVVEKNGRKVYSIETETRLDCPSENSDLISKTIVDPITYKVLRQEIYLKQAQEDLLLYTAVTETTKTKESMETVKQQLAKVQLVTYVPEEVSNVQKQVEPVL